VVFNLFLCDFYVSHCSLLPEYSDENQTEAGAIDCDPSDPNQDYRDPNLACKYSLSRLGSECVSEKHYGYDVGRPCVMLKMNKV